MKLGVGLRAAGRARVGLCLGATALYLLGPSVVPISAGGGPELDSVAGVGAPLAGRPPADGPVHATLAAPQSQSSVPAGAETFARANPALRLSKAGKASEYYDLLARLDTGHVVLARFLVTNVGPGSRTAVALGQIIHPDGRSRTFRNGQRKRGWRVSDDRLRMDIKNSHLDLHWGEARLEITKQSTQIDLRFPLNRLRPLPAGISRAQYGSDLLAANAPVTGRMRVERISGETAISGSASLTHTYLGKLEETRVQRRIEIFSVDNAETSLEVVEIRLPSGETFAWLHVARRGVTIAAIGSIRLREVGHLEGTESRYPVAQQFMIEGPGVEGRVELEGLLFGHNPMKAIPQPARSIIRWTSKARPRQIWARSKFDVTLRLGAGQAPFSLAGEALTAVGYLRPD